MLRLSREMGLSFCNFAKGHAANAFSRGKAFAALQTQTMKNFAAIDFETANQCRSSVCSVGVVVVRDGKVTDKFYSLIYPHPYFFSYWNTRVHGLTLEDVADAPEFPDVWS